MFDKQDLEIIKNCLEATQIKGADSHTMSALLQKVGIAIGRESFSGETKVSDRINKGGEA